MKPEASDVFLSMKATCELLGLSRWTVTNLIETGELAAIKGPSKNSPLRITKASIDAYISRNTVKADRSETR